MVQPQRLEHAPKAVIEMHAEQGHGDDIEAGYEGVLETGDDVRAHIEKTDYDAGGGSAASYTAVSKSDIETYRQLAAATGLKEE